MIFGCFWLFSYIFHLKSNELQKYIKFLNNLQSLFFNMYYDKNRDVVYCVHKKMQRRITLRLCMQMKYEKINDYRATENFLLITPFSVLIFIRYMPADKLSVLMEAVVPLALKSPTF